MMLTNKPSLPNHLYLKILKERQSNPYKEFVKDKSKRIFRVSELSRAPLPGYLREKFKDTISYVVDVSYYLTMLFGTAVHDLLQGTDTEDIVFEKQLSKDIDIEDIGKFTLVGTVDEYDIKNNKVTDNKTAKVSQVGYGVDEDYVWQVNIYAWMLGLKNPVLSIRYFYKDWSPMAYVKELKKDPMSKYPQHMIMEYSVPAKSAEEVEQHVMERIVDHVCNPDRECTLEERRLGTPIIYAVKKPGADRSMRNFESMEDAVAYQQGLPVDKVTEIEVRAEDNACIYYCESKSVCPYAKSKGY